MLRTACPSAPLAVCAALLPAAASAASVSVGTDFSFPLSRTDAGSVSSDLVTPLVNGYFSGRQRVSLQGFEAATGLGIERLRSVTLTIEDTTTAAGNGGIFSRSGGGLTAVPDDMALFNSFRGEAATENNPDGAMGIRVTSTSSSTTAAGADLSVFAMDTLGVDVMTDVAFYGFLGQLDNGRGFSTEGFARLTYDYEDGDGGPVAAVPTPAAALAGLAGLGAVVLGRRRLA